MLKIVILFLSAKLIVAQLGDVDDLVKLIGGEPIDIIPNRHKQENGSLACGGAILPKKDAFSSAFCTYRIPSYVWSCENEKCERKIEKNRKVLCGMLKSNLYPSIEVCRLVCGSHGALWPVPTGKIELNSTIVHIHPNKITLKIVKDADPHGFLNENFKMFKEDILGECGTNCQEVSASEVVIKVDVDLESLVLNWGTNESYSLTVVPETDQNIVVNIKSYTLYGARHGLETLKQLIASYTFVYSSQNYENSALVLTGSATIFDRPVYPHRGLLLDTSRNFVSISTIKRQITAMAASKLNVFHWHISDAYSFPFHSKRVPKLTEYGAYSQSKVYAEHDIKELVWFAKLRGVRIVFEIDAPAQAGNGWQFGPEDGLGNLSLCVNKRPWRDYCGWPPCGQLNPINEFLYPILGQLYNDIIDLIPGGEAFHMGGYGFSTACWNSSQEIRAYLESNGISPTFEAFLDLWGHFQSEALKQFDKKSAGTLSPIIVWSSALTEVRVITKYLSNQRYVIQSWEPAAEPSAKNLLDLGYKLIISPYAVWYLNHGFSGSTQYHNWEVVYNNMLIDHPHVLGGETCSWGEIDDAGMDSRIWPRAAAVAERLWANPSTGSAQAQVRLARHRERLVTRGIDAHAILTEWCYNTEGECP